MAPCRSEEALQGASATLRPATALPEGVCSLPCPAPTPQVCFLSLTWLLLIPLLLH